MGTRRIAILKRIYGILNDVTPLAEDCGMLCGGRCCQGSDQDGMWLLPDEEKILEDADFLSIRESADGKYAVCNGTCRRELRPVACRIYPYFPILQDGDPRRAAIQVVPDIRAAAVCSLLQKGAPEISPVFRRAVRRAGRLMLGDRRLRVWLKQSGDFIVDIARIQGKLE